MSNHDCNLKMDEFCCVCVAEEIEAKDAEIERLTAELSRLRQHCHKISAEMSDQAAMDYIAKLEADRDKWMASSLDETARCLKLEAVRKATVMYLNDSSIYKMRKLEEALKNTEVKE